MGKAIQSDKPIKRKTPAQLKSELDDVLTALEDILLTVGNPNTETGHRVKLIAERAIAKARKR